MDLWIVGRYPEDPALPWEFLGVFDSRERAIDACTGPRDFIGPAVLNRRGPEERIEWVAVEYPKAEAS